MRKLREFWLGDRKHVFEKVNSRAGQTDVSNDLTELAEIRVLKESKISVYSQEMVSVLTLLVY